MKKKTFAFVGLALALIMLLGGCVASFSTGGVKGTGDIVSRNFETKDFSAIDIRMPFTVTWKEGQQTTVTVQMHENLFEYLKISVKNNTLIADASKSFNILGSKPQLHITTPSLTALTSDAIIEVTDCDTVKAESFLIKLDGASSIDMNLEVESLDVSSSGGAKLKLSGNANTANIDTEGAVDFSAFDLQTADTRIKMQGAGKLDIAVSTTLDVKLEGVCKVSYKGNPVVTKKIEGLATVSNAD